MISTKTKTETDALIDAPQGKLELIVGKENNKPSWGIVCHPHPLHGGTMNNKVVTTLVKTFQGMGLNTIRFNFRGVGQSTGSFDEGNGELVDLFSVIDWVQREHGGADFWLAGFSFGAYVAYRAATTFPAKALVTVAPPVEHFPMQELPPVLCKWVLVQGERDEVVPPKAVFDWAEERDPKPIVIRFPEAGHFFHGQLTELRMEITRALTE